MKKFTQLFAGLAVAAGLLTAASPSASAQLNYKQVGTPNTTGLAYLAKTSNLPVYTMNKYGQGISLYRAAAIDLPANTTIKEIAFLGWQELDGEGNEKDFTGATYKVYVANAGTSLDYKDFIVAGPNEGSSATTVLDTSKATLFYEGALNIPTAGSREDLKEVIKATSSQGFVYTGGNLMVYVEFSVPKSSPHTNFIVANQQGVTFQPNGAYRDSPYTADYYGGGYGINTKKWSEYSGKQMPVMKLGYAGEAHVIKAEISGKIISSLRNSNLAGADVKLMKGTETVATTISETSGAYSFTVEEVDVNATYSITASKDGYESATLPIDIKSGGKFTNQDITLTKLPVPAVLSGTVINKETQQPVISALVRFNGDMTTTKADGKYSFNIANVDLLPSDGLELTASAAGYNAYSTTLRVTADMTFNVEMVPLPPLPGEGAQIGEYNTVDYSYQAPFNSLWNVTHTETIYPSGILGALKSGTKYSSVNFYGYLSPVSTPDPDEGGDDSGDDPYGGYSAPAKAEATQSPWKGNVKIYMLNTTDSRFTSASTPTDLESLTPLFEGDVTINEGGANNAPVLLFTADFAQPFVYGGDNIKLIAVTSSNTARLVYFCQDPTYTDNVFGKYGTNQESFDAMKYSVVNCGVPVIKLGDYVPTANVYGTVTDKKTSAPVEGAVVTLAKGTDKVSATTDAEGKYQIDWRGVTFNETYTLNVEKAPYDEITSDVSFTDATLNMQYNAQLTVSGTVSGKVTDKVTGNALADMTVKVFAADNTEVTLDAAEAKTADDGTYMVTIPEVDFATYTVEISGGKYIAEKKEVTFSTEKVANEDVDFEMTFNATVSGKVTFSDGPAVAGASVKIGELTATTDEEGAYSISVAPVTAASGDVTVEYGGNQVYTGTVDLTTGAEITFDIKLDLSGVDAVFAGEGKADVYGINGVVIARDADASVVKTLPAGIYIVNGKKMVIAK